MSHFRRLAFLALCIALLSLSIPISAFAAPSAQECTPSGETVKRGGELTFARSEDPSTWDPVVPGDNGAIYLITNVMETLVRADATGTGLEPGLAESWEISDDRLTYTFHLRDSTFSNGNPVTVDDVIFSLGRSQEGSYSFIFEPIETIERTDDKTVTITLNRPFTPFLSVMALFQAAIIPQDVFEADPDGFGSAPIGSGPFMVEEYTRSDKTVLVPNPYYWELGADCEPLPYLDRIILPYISETNSRVLGFRNGDFDIIAYVPQNEAASIEATEGVTLEVQPIYRLDYVFLNHGDPIVGNRDFRLALNYAVDRSVIMDLIYFGYGEIPNSFMPKMNYWSADVPLIPYDPAKAQELLASSGYAGEMMTIQISAGDAPAKQLATVMQQMWAAVGINTEILEVDPASSFGELVAGNYQIAPGYITSDINDDDELASIMAITESSDFFAFFTWYDNPEVTEWLNQAREADDPAERAELYAKIQEQVYYNDAYSIPLNFAPVLHAYYDYVKGFRTLSVGWWWLANVWIDQ